MPETSLKIAAAAHHDHDDDDEERNEKIDKVSSKKVEQIGFFLLFKRRPNGFNCAIISDLVSASASLASVFSE